ncbi:MAG: hypothetical protein AAGH68_05000 [Pseudomonadota bacterium]
MRDALGRPLILALLAVMGCELGHLYLGVPALRDAAHLAMGAVVLTAMPRFGLREGYLVCLSLLLVGLLIRLHPEPWAAARRAMDQAVFLMAFILLLSLVQEAAMTSRSVEQVGTYLSRQPGGRRFTGLFGGTMLMGVVFNLGTVTLLAPLIRRSAEAAPNDPLTPIRERRQLNAVLRGFAWCVVWSPTAVAPLALLGLIDGIDRPRWIAIGFCLSCLMLVIGWAEDRIAWRRYTAGAMGLPPVERAPLPLGAVLRFLSVCVVFMGLTGLIILATGLGIPAGLMGAAPVLLLGWLWVQSGGWPFGLRCINGAASAPKDAPYAALRERLRGIAGQGLPASAPAAVTLAAAGFVGIAGAELIPARAWAEALGLNSWPAWVFMTTVTLAVVALSQFALSPIMMAVFFGAILGSLPSLPAEPTLTALAIAAGWSVSTTISPFASGVILMSRITGHPGARLTYGWNPLFTALTMAVLTLVYWALTGGA